MNSIQMKSPKQTIRAYCQHCLGLKQFNTESIRDCQGDQAFLSPCPFFPYRLGKRILVKVFRAFCLDCMGGSPSMVLACQAITCRIYPYRFGKNPARIGQGRSSEDMARLRAVRITVSKKISAQNQFSPGK